MTILLGQRDAFWSEDSLKITTLRFSQVGCNWIPTEIMIYMCVPQDVFTESFLT